MDFREEINLKMKSFVKMSKRRVTDHLYADINSSVSGTVFQLNLEEGLKVKPWLVYRVYHLIVG